MPHGILFDHGIRDYPLEVIADADFLKVFMRSSAGDLPFDFFAASFWLLSRYEEHLPHKADHYNRFSFRSSLAYQYNFMQVPLVNLWLQVFKNKLLKRSPRLSFTNHKYSFLSTIDIDNAYQYKYKGFVRTMAGILSDKRLSKTKERLKIILGFKNDPFDCYDFLIQTHQQNQINALFFILLGDYGPNDKNHSASDLRFQSLIKHLKDYAMVGIHPSFGSNKTSRQLQVEVHRLSSITHSLTTQSRQHFSMLKFPDTYQNLLQAGINADYSMGYTNYNGFRASYCYPFKWYSLENEATTPLTIHPFCLSENTLLSQTKNNHQLMLQQSKELIDEVKKYQGECISIFHNDNFDKALNDFYTDFLKMAKTAD
ncbi:MAG: polysaccharide deacetylase family protein [Bacteroidota bacterium]